MRLYQESLNCYCKDSRWIPGCKFSLRRTSFETIHDLNGKFSEIPEHLFLPMHSDMLAKLPPKFYPLLYAFLPIFLHAIPANYDIRVRWNKSLLQSFPRISVDSPYFALKTSYIVIQAPELWPHMWLCLTFVIKQSLILFVSIWV